MLYFLYTRAAEIRSGTSCFLHLETLTQISVPVIRTGLSLTRFVIGRDRRGKFTILTSRNLLFLDSKFYETL